MRRLWARASPGRLLLMVAAISALSGAASRPIYSAAVTADCSEQTARQVVAQYPEVNIFGLDDPVRQALCGSFTGEGSNAMAVTIGAPTCWGIQNWAVFRFTAGAWQLVLNQPAYLVPPLVADGSDIRETTEVHRAGDARCIFRGGTHARSWHWDGAHLVAGPWKQVTKGEPVTRYFYTPSKNIWCVLGDGSDYRGVTCTSFKAPQSVKMKADGALHICHGRRCLGCGCAPDPIRTLAYGRRLTVGRFRCRSEQAGVTCIVIETRKGFRINRDDIRRVGP